MKSVSQTKKTFKESISNFNLVFVRLKDTMKCFASDLTGFFVCWVNLNHLFDLFMFNRSNIES